MLPYTRGAPPRTRIPKLGGGLERSVGLLGERVARSGKGDGALAGLEDECATTATLAPAALLARKGAQAAPLRLRKLAQKDEAVSVGSVEAHAERAQGRRRCGAHWAVELERAGVRSAGGRGRLELQPCEDARGRVDPLRGRVPRKRALAVCSKAARAEQALSSGGLGGGVTAAGVTCPCGELAR